MINPVSIDLTQPQYVTGEGEKAAPRILSVEEIGERIVQEIGRQDFIDNTFITDSWFQVADFTISVPEKEQPYINNQTLPQVAGNEISPIADMIREVALRLSNRWNCYWCLGDSIQIEIPNRINIDAQNIFRIITNDTNILDKKKLIILVRKFLKEDVRNVVKN